MGGAKILDTASVRRRVLTFALVGQGFGESRDPITALAPFLMPIANDLAGQGFDAGIFRSEMRSRYGIELSRDVTEVFVDRLIRLSFLKKGHNGYPGWVRQNDLAVDDGIASDKLNDLVKEAATFHEKQKDLLHENFDEDRFLQAILTVLLDQNRALQSAISAVEASNGGEENFTNISKTLKPKNGDEFLASEFISWAARHSKDTFSWLAELSGTAFVSEALIELRTPQLNQNIRPDLNVYLDTPLLMELLGCSGKAAYEDAKLIVSTLKSLGISANVMDHSLEEMHRNLSAVLKMEARNRTGPSAAALLAQEVTTAYLESVRDGPEHFIGLAGVHIIKPKSLAHLADARSFTEEDERVFYAAIQSLHESDPPRWHDVESISWILRRRKGETSKDVFRSKHLLVTRNSRLVSAANRIAGDRCNYPRGASGPAILARDLAGVLWLVVGQTQRTEISKRQLILSCDRARSAAPQIIHGMYEAIRKVDVGNAELFWAAVQKPAYLSIAMNAAAGSGPDPTEAALESIRADLVAEERAKSADRLQRQKAAFDAEATLNSIIIESLKTQKTDLEKTNEAALDHARIVSKALWNKQANRALLSARLISAVFHIVLLAAAVTGGIVGTDRVNLPWQFKALIAFIVSVVLLYLANERLQTPFRTYISQYFRKLYDAELERLVGPQADAVRVMDGMISIEHKS